jgi:hypothetical protein
MLRFNWEYYAAGLQLNMSCTPDENECAGLIYVCMVFLLQCCTVLLHHYGIQPFFANLKIVSSQLQRWMVARANLKSACDVRLRLPL